jgi:transcriptional regulator GlxA family with amidase domain
MRHHLSYSPTDVAQRLDIGMSTLNRLFRATIGLSPGKVLNILRLERSRYLLTATNNDIDTIADICGYCDRHHFTRHFSNTFGMGPAHYRTHDGNE